MLLIGLLFAIFGAKVLFFFEMHKFLIFFLQNSIKKSNFVAKILITI